MEALRSRGIDAVLFDQSSVEPTDVSFKEAVAFAVKGRFDGYVAVGGGSSMDTCKAANLYATHPADFMTYVNPPVGKGTPVPGPLKPMMAIPTTAGTGSETTGVTIFDYLEMGAKTGIAQPGPAAHTRADRPRQHPFPAQDGGGLHGTGRVDPRPGSHHGPAVQPAPGSGTAPAQTGLPGRQPHQPRVGVPGH